MPSARSTPRRDAAPCAASDRRAPRGAGSAPHRRDQARLAVGRPDRRGRRGHRRPGPRLRGRRRGRDLGAVRAALVRRLGRRPAGGAGCGRGAGPRQGLRRRRGPAAAPSRRRRRPRPAARGPPPGPATRAPRRAGPGARARAARRGPRRARARAGARERGADHRAQQPRPADARGRSSSAPRRLRELVPDDRLVVAESGVREPRDRRPLARARVRWRAGRRGARPAPATRRPPPARSSRPAPPPTTRPTSRAGPFVKICGVTDEAGVLAAVAAGADAIGLNVVAGTPRALALDEAATLARLARTAAGGDRRPLVVAITADADRAWIDATIAAFDPDVVQLSGERAGRRRGRRSPRRTWKVLHLPAAEPARPSPVRRTTSCRALGPTSPAGSTGSSSTPPAGRIRAGPARAASERLAAAIAREVPVTLAGGLDPAQRRRRPARDPGRRRRRRVGRGAAAHRGRAADQGPVPRRPVRQAGPSRPRRPPEPAVRPDAGPSRAARRRRRRSLGAGARLRRPVRPGDADGRARAARGGLRRAPPGPGLLGRAARAAARRSPAARPPLYRADRLADAVRAEADGWPPRRRSRRRRRSRASGSTSSARTSPTPAPTRSTTRSARRCSRAASARRGSSPRPAPASTASRPRPPARCSTCRASCTWAPRTSSARARTSCGCARSAPRSARSRRARRRSRTRSTRRCATGSRTSQTTHYVLGSAMGPHPYPTIVRDLQRRIGDEAAAQLAAVEGRLPDLALACVGGGSNAIGLLARFIGEPSVRLAVVEAAGDGIDTGRHAAAILGGTPGILHGSRSLMLQDADGQVIEAHSASAGLDYPGIGPQLAALAEGGRIEVAAATDREAVAAMKATTRTEGILPALETAHAVAALPEAAGRDRRGRGLVAGRGPRPPRVLRPRRQGPGRARAVRRRRAVGERPVTARRTLVRVDRVRHQRDGRRPAHRGGLRPGAGRTAAPRSSRTSWPAIPMPRRASRSPSPRPTPAPTCSRSGCPYSDPLADGATLQRASGAALGRGRDPRAFAPAHRADRGRPAGPAARADGLRQPGHRRRRRRGGREAPGRRRCGRAHRRRPDARRGRPVRGRRPRRRAGRRLPRRPDDAGRAPRVRGGPERRLPVLRLARRA